MRTAWVSAAVFTAAALLAAAVLVFTGTTTSSTHRTTPAPPVDLTAYTGGERALLERVEQTSPALLADPAETLATIRAACATLPQPPLSYAYLNEATAALSRDGYDLTRAEAATILETARTTVCAEGRTAMGTSGN